MPRVLANLLCFVALWGTPALAHAKVQTFKLKHSTLTIAPDLEESWVLPATSGVSWDVLVRESKRLPKFVFKIHDIDAKASKLTCDAYLKQLMVTDPTWSSGAAPSWTPKRWHGTIAKRPGQTYEFCLQAPGRLLVVGSTFAAKGRLSSSQASDFQDNTRAMLDAVAQAAAARSAPKPTPAPSTLPLVRMNLPKIFSAPLVFRSPRNWRVETQGSNHGLLLLDVAGKPSGAWVALSAISEAECIKRFGVNAQKPSFKKVNLGLFKDPVWTKPQLTSQSKEGNQVFVCAKQGARALLVVMNVRTDQHLSALAPLLRALEDHAKGTKATPAKPAAPVTTQRLSLPYLNKTISVRSPLRWESISNARQKLIVRTVDDNHFLSAAPVTKAASCAALMSVISKRSKLPAGPSPLPRPRQWERDVVVKRASADARYVHLQGCWVHRGVVHHVQMISADPSFGTLRPVVAALDAALGTPGPRPTPRAASPAVSARDAKAMEAQLLDELSGNAVGPAPKPAASRPPSSKRTTASAKRRPQASGIDWGDGINVGDVGFKVGLTSLAEVEDSSEDSLLGIGLTMEFMTGAEDGPGVVTGLLFHGGLTSDASLYTDLAYRLGLGLDLESIELVITGQAGLDWIGQTDRNTLSLPASAYAGPYVGMSLWFGDAFALRTGAGLFWRWVDSPNVLRAHASLVFGDEDEAITLGAFYDRYDDLGQTLGISMSMSLGL